jgi:hypothetical protein
VHILPTLQDLLILASICANFFYGIVFHPLSHLALASPR